MKKNIAIIFIISIFAATACFRTEVEKTSSNENNSAEQTAAEGSQTVSDKPKQDNKTVKNQNSKSFRGMINGINFEMNLVREGDELSGTYFYTKIGKDLKLSGKIDKNGEFNLTETDDKGNKTGEWSGTWKEEENAPGVMLEGDWKKPNDKETLGFYATEQTVEFSGDAKFTDKIIKENDKKNNSELYAVYPEISGVDSATATKFNAKIKGLVKELNDSYKEQVADYAKEDVKSPNAPGFSSDVSYDTILANDDLVSLIFADYAYLGGAHGNTAYTTVNYDLKNNREIKLEELFEPKSDHLKKISAYSIADLKKRVGDLSDDDWISKGASADAANFQNWNLTKKGLMFTFEPYQVAAYAAGSQTVVVPYEKLNGILRKDSIAAKLAK